MVIWTFRAATGVSGHCGAGPLAPSGEEMLGYPSVFRAATSRAAPLRYKHSCLVPTTTRRPRRAGKRKVCSAGGGKSRKPASSLPISLSSRSPRQRPPSSA
ncbi:hypothetical protein CGQ14_34070, partial [Pseudomonas aeruginosa]